MPTFPFSGRALLALLAAMAADLSHAVERAADFPGAARGLHRRRPAVLLDAVARCAGAARVRRARAHRAALEQFVLRRVAHTANRTGVLIFVSLAERYARIIADEGIAAKVHNAEWQAAIDALTGHMRDGRIAAGFIAAIERCGAVLADARAAGRIAGRIAGSPLRDVALRTANKASGPPC